jgi:hypothetical protein
MEVVQGWPPSPIWWCLKLQGFHCRHVAMHLARVAILGCRADCRRCSLKLADHAAVAAFGVCLAGLSQGRRQYAAGHRRAVRLQARCRRPAPGASRQQSKPSFWCVEFESTPRRFAIAVQGCGGSLSFWRERLFVANYRKSSSRLLIRTAHVSVIRSAHVSDH